MTSTAGRSRWWVLAALAVTTLTVGLDSTIVSVALPTLAADLHASNSQLQWFADSYNLTLSMALLPTGLLGDRIGRKKVLIAALVLFGASSAVCSYATDPGQLIIARAVLGVAGAAMVPMSVAVLPVVFPEEERGKAMSVWVAASAAGFPIGPILGGWMLNSFWWGSVFLINVPVALLAIVGLVFLMPESRNPHRPRIDWIGIAASSIGLAALTYGVILLGQNGWGDTWALVSSTGGALALALFILWQMRLSRLPAGEPLIDLGLFRSRSFRWATILVCVVSFSMFGVLFATPQFFTVVEGADALGNGLRLLPIIGGLLVGARAGSQLVPKLGDRVVIGAGFAVMAVGLIMGALTGSDTPYGYVAAWVAITGAGLGLSLPASMTVALNTLSEDATGVGSALLQALRQVAGTIAVAVLGTVLAVGYRNRLNVTGLNDRLASATKTSAIAGKEVAARLHSPSLLDSVRNSFVHGMSLMLWVTGIMAVVGVALALAFLPAHSHKAASPAATGEEDEPSTDRNRGAIV